MCQLKGDKSCSKYLYNGYPRPQPDTVQILYSINRYQILYSINNVLCQTKVNFIFCLLCGF